LKSQAHDNVPAAKATVTNTITVIPTLPRLATEQRTIVFVQGASVIPEYANI